MGVPGTSDQKLFRLLQSSRDRRGPKRPAPASERTQLFFRNQVAMRPSSGTPATSVRPVPGGFDSAGQRPDSDQGGFLVNAEKPNRQSITQVVVLGGGFAGIYAVRRLEKLFGGRDDVQITLVSRDNFLLMTPLLFEVCSGKLEMSACSISIREFLRTVEFIEGRFEAIDLEGRFFLISSGAPAKRELQYDHLVLALGSLTNTSRIKGSELAFTFKTLADAVLLRNHVIERMERAVVESDASLRRRELTFVVIGGGLVGVEVFGELSAFMDEVVRYYPRIQRDEIHLHLLEAGQRIMPEISERLANYSARVLSRRLGVSIRTNAPVERIAPGQVHLKDQVLEAST